MPFVSSLGAVGRVKLVCCAIWTEVELELDDLSKKANAHTLVKWNFS